MNRKMYFWNLAGKSQICVEYLKLLLKIETSRFRRFEVQYCGGVFSLAKV